MVIAGGGPIGLQFLGALEHLNEQGFWNFEEIESIYATSIGTFLGAIICLKYDWETLNTYIMSLSCFKYKDYKFGIIGTILGVIGTILGVIGQSGTIIGITLVVSSLI